MKKIFLCVLVFFFSTMGVFAGDIKVEDIFSDISSDYIYRSELQELFDRGMIIPDASGKFGPNEYLNRDEFVGISMEVTCKRCIQPHTEFGYIEKFLNQDVYFDINSNNKYFYCIAEADDQNFVRGYDVGEACQNGSSKFGARPFCPLNRINLEEAVAVLLRNSGIFTIEDNNRVIADIRAGKITEKLGNDVLPKDSEGNSYTFYGYIRKALDYKITTYGADGSSRNIPLIELDTQGNINPNKSITKEEFLRMSYIALKSNNCSIVSKNNLALKMNIWEKACNAGSAKLKTCTQSTLNDPENTYDFEADPKTTCELGIDEQTGYVWRFQHIKTGQQFLKYGKFIDNYSFLTDGEWRVYLRVVDKCGNTGNIYSTIVVGVPSVPNDIDVDIVVYDDPCKGSDDVCEEIKFPNRGGDGDDIYDFDGDVETKCKIGVVKYDWKISHIPSGQVYSHKGKYINDFEFSRPGEWLVVLTATDGCGNTGKEQETYIVKEDKPNIDVDIVVYDDSCKGSDDVCEEIKFPNRGGDGDDIYDFDGDVETKCKIGVVKYDWKISHIPSGQVYSHKGKYINDFEFSRPGEWLVILTATDGCGNTGKEQETYIVFDNSGALDVGILAKPIFGYEDLVVDFEGIVSGGEKPYSYRWNFGDGGIDFGKNIDYMYDFSGIYEVLLRVTDKNGLTGSATVIIQVLERESCNIDSDGDGIFDCNDLCPIIVGTEQNQGCPILERNCDKNCACPAGYTCNDTDSLTCGSGQCVPIFKPKISCLFNPNQGSIFGTAVCNSCPCAAGLDFLADMRRCDVIFPAITSPNAQEIYSRGKPWFIQ